MLCQILYGGLCVRAEHQCHRLREVLPPKIILRSRFIVKFYIVFYDKSVYNRVDSDHKKGVHGMPNIRPISDLRNYPAVLQEVAVGSPVYLTKNGRGRYAIIAIDEYENFERTKAELQLMFELEKGRKTGEEKGWLSEDEVRAHFGAKKMANNIYYSPSAGILGVFQALTTKSEPKKTSQIVQIIFEQCLR